MRTGRKFSSKNSRAAVAVERARRRRAPADSRKARIDRPAVARPSRALPGTGGSSTGRSRRRPRDRRRPSRRSVGQATGSSCVSGELPGAAFGFPVALDAGGRRRSGASPAQTAAPLICRQTAQPKPRATIACCASGHGSLPGFGRDQLPVGIARRDIAREGPHVGHVGDLVGAAVDHVAVLRSRVTETSCETKRTVTCAVVAPHFGAGDVGPCRSTRSGSRPSRPGSRAR